MKHNKFFTLLGILLMVPVIMCSCNMSIKDEATIEYVALEIGSFDTIDGGNHISEYPIWNPEMLNYHQDQSAPKEVSVIFNGKTYEGNYQKTSVSIPNTYLTHRYEGENVYFETNDVTGELTSISFIYEPSNDATLTEIDCKVIADSIADDYIVLNDYRIETTSFDIYENIVYSFTYYREINGYKTSDSLTVSIDGNGKIFSFGMNSLGAFEEVESVTYNSEKGQNAINSKLNDIYKGKSSRKGYTIDNTILVRLEDGNVALLYTVSNQFENDNVTHQSQVQLLVKMPSNSKKQ